MIKILIAFFLTLTLNVSFAGVVTVTNINNAGVGSLRNTITTATAGDTIRFSPSLISGGSVSIVLTSEILCDKNLTIIGLYNSTDTLTISGNNTNRILKIDLTTSTNKVFFMDSVVVKHANVVGDGGAILFKGGSDLFFYNSVFNNNSATNGGAIYTSSALSFNNCKLNHNTALNNGGAVFATSFDSTKLTSFNTTLFFSNSEISHNKAFNDGGGIYSTAYSLRTSSFVSNSNSFISLNNCKVSSNEAINKGGGIYSISNNSSASVSYNSSSTSNVSLANSFLSDNKAPIGGGGIYSTANNSTGASSPSTATSVSTIFIANSSIKRNVSSGIGGGICSITTNPVSNKSRGSSSVTIKNSSIDSNSSEQGGGVFSYSTSSKNISCNSIINIDSSQMIGNHSVYGGGGVYSKVGSPNINHICNSNITIKNSIIKDNQGRAGAGIHSNTENGKTSVIVRDSEVAYNKGDGDGGGLYFNDYGSTGSSYLFYNSSFTENSSTNNGGGIYVNSTSSYLDVNRCRFERDSAKDGGAIYGSVLSFHIQYSLIDDNYSSRYGGGLYSSANNLKIFDCLLSNNETRYNGGAVNAEFNSNISIDRSTFYKNRSSNSGGAIYFRTYSGYTSALRVDRSTIVNNYASNFGGGIYGNQAQSSGSNSTIILKSSIVALNSTTDITNENASSTAQIISEGYNIIGNSSIGGSIATDQTGIDSATLQLDVLGSNGGPFFTIKPKLGSSAINMGTPNDTSRAANGLVVDSQRDVGACENGALVYASIKKINKSKEFGFKVFPNPNNGTFTLQFDNEQEITSLFITDINGRLIKEITPQKTLNYEINFEGASGIYFLNLVTDNKRRTLKLVKE